MANGAASAKYFILTVGFHNLFSSLSFNVLINEMFVINEIRVLIQAGEA